VLPSVVQITTGQGSGSGVGYDTRGDIVTNAHVVGTATTLQVGLPSSGTPLTATVAGVFAPNDLVVIRVQAGADSLHPASFGRSASVRVGEIVLAMGNPLGLTGTVTDGIVSATGRTVSEGRGSSAVLISAVQTSAAINPGHSGGALADLSSQVIGIATLAAADPQPGGAAAGIGFAIPSDTVTSIAAQLIATGKVTDSGRASLGITAPTVADASGQPAGVGVISVTPAGATAKADIQPDDIITGLAGQPGALSVGRRIQATAVCSVLSDFHAWMIQTPMAERFTRNLDSLPVKAIVRMRNLKPSLILLDTYAWRWGPRGTSTCSTSRRTSRSIRPGSLARC